MAVRFILLEDGEHDHSSALAIAAERGFTAAKLGSRLLLVRPAIASLPISKCPGVVVGEMFRAGPPSVRVDAFNHIDEDLLCGDAETMGRAFWGSYVVLLARGPDLIVRRDPSGTMPCLAASLEGRAALASDMGMLELFDWRARIDLHGLVQCLCTGNLPARRTALEGVEDVLPGTELVLSARGASVRQWWSPWKHVEVHDREPAFRVFDAVCDATAALSAPHDRLLLGASGGLDSSIVAASLPGAADRLTCFTVSTRDARGDERQHARSLARHLGLELIERWYSVCPSDLRHSASAHLPAPRFSATVAAYARLQLALCDQNKPDAFLTGLGGDNVFGFTHSAAPVLDRLRQEGIGSGLFATVGDVAAITGSGVGQVLRSAWKRSRWDVPYRWRTDATFLDPEIAREASACEVRHAWLAFPPDALPGKAAHVAAILRGQIHVEGLLDRSHPPTICPLMSQPVMEACLPVESWRWCEGGWNRAVARIAFAPLLPADVTWRRSKGSPDGHAHALFTKFGHEIRDRLLGGWLARRGILDLNAIKTAFGRAAASTASELVRIFDLLDAELWADYWSGRDTRADQSGTVRTTLDES